MVRQSIVAGVDLGATNVRVAIGGPDGALYGYAKRDTPTSDSGLEIAESVADTFEAACADGECAVRDVEGTGIGSLGPLDPDEGAVVDPPNLPGVERVPLVETLENLTGSEVSLYNDAAAGALGVAEASPDAPRNLVYVTMSTGIGAGAIVDGTLLVGERGNAAEVGHIVVDTASRLQCGCGGEGHWEAFAAGSNIPRYARHLASDRDLETSLSLDTLDAAEVFAADDDPLARAVVEGVGDVNALGVAATVHAYDPAVVFLGGAVAVNNPEAVLTPIRERLPDLVVTTAPEVRITPLGDRTVVTGALAAVRKDRLSEG